MINHPENPTNEQKLKELADVVLLNDERLDFLFDAFNSLAVDIANANSEQPANRLIALSEQMSAHYRDKIAERNELRKLFGLDETKSGQLTESNVCHQDVGDTEHRCAGAASPERAIPTARRVLKKLGRKLSLLKVCILAFCRILRSAFSRLDKF